MDKLPTHIFDELDTLYLPTIKYQGVQHPKLLIFFSGPPGSGKSTVARAVEAHFQAIRIENDAVRKLLAEHFPELGEEARNGLVYTYTRHIAEYLHASTGNGLWVIDSSIDRRYEEYFAFAKQHGFATFVIAMSIPEDTHKAWIIKGGNRPFNVVQVYLERMPARRQEQAAFLASYRPDIVIEPGYDVEKVFEAIERKLTGLTT